MANMSPILACGGSSEELCNFWEIQVNNEHMVTNNIWYKEDDDFTTTERGGKFEGSTEDVVQPGNPRERIDVTSFKETETLTIAESINQAFNQILFEVQMQDDNYILDFMKRGLNIKHTVCFPTGMVIKEWNCVAVSNMDAILRKKNGTENETALDLQFNNAPIVKRVGFVSDILPKGISEVTLDASYTDEDDLVITVTNIVDIDTLVVPTTDSSTYQCMLYDKDTKEVINTQYSDTPVEFTFMGVTPGDYIGSIAYHYFMDSNGVKHYRVVKNLDIEVI